MEQPETLPVDSPQVFVVLANGSTQDTVVWLGGEHDLSSAEELMQAIATAVESGRSDVVIDLSGVEFMDSKTIDFMDSTTIDQILAARIRLGAQGRKARIRAPSHAARYLLEICGLTHLVGS
jgi:anti-anti-sigma regulatory factor